MYTKLAIAEKRNELPESGDVVHFSWPQSTWRWLVGVLHCQAKGTKQIVENIMMDAFNAGGEQFFSAPALCQSIQFCYPF
jgi:hypothetical protein